MLIGSKPIGTVAYLGGVPAVLEEFCYSLAQLLTFSREALCTDRQYVHLDRVKFSDHGPARNALAERFLGEWLLMLDTDHQFEPDLLLRLLHQMGRHDLQVLTGLYRFKQPPCSPVLYCCPDGGSPQPVARYPTDLDVFEVDSAGAGCLLVRRVVFDRIAEELKEGPFDRLPGLSEDHSFFRRLKRLGIKAYCAPAVECYHLRVEPVTESFQDSGALVVSEPFAVGGLVS